MYINAHTYTVYISEKCYAYVTYVTLAHKTFFKIEMYTSSGSWINNLSIDVWFVMIGQYLTENLESEGAKILRKSPLKFSNEVHSNAYY